MKAVIYAGPTLPKPPPLSVAVEIRPPVAQGDVYRACCAGASVIGIIDGYFENQPAVWHKEILWALSRGVVVYGAASLGALRAAELHTFGMVGVGRIFEMFKDGTLTDDDEVALIHAPADQGFSPLSTAMVNIRATLARAVEAQVIPPADARALVSLAKGAHYKHRSYELLLRSGRQAGVSPLVLQALADWLPSGMVDQKQLDALELIQQIVRHAAEPDGVTERPRFRFEHTYFWESASLNARLTATAGNTSASFDDTLDELAIQGSWQVHERLGAWRGIALDEARRSGLRPTEEDVDAYIRAFRQERGLEELSTFEVYLEGMGISPAGFWRLAADEVVLVRLTQMYARSTQGEVLDQLRITGAFDPARERAERKAALLQRCGQQRSQRWSDAELLAWWFSERLERAIPDDIETYAVSAGFRSTPAFQRAILRERLLCEEEQRLVLQHASEGGLKADRHALGEGDPVSAVVFTAEDQPFDLASLAGSIVVLVFGPRSTDLSTVKGLADADDVVVVHMTGHRATAGSSEHSGALCLVDRDGALARRLGIEATEPTMVVLDAAQRLRCRSSGLSAMTEVLAVIRRLLGQAGGEAPETHPPVLLVPGVFEPAFCDELVETWSRGERWDIGITARTAVGTKNNVMDGGYKKRLDHVVESDDVRAGILSRLTRRLLPAVDLAFSYAPTDWEPFSIGCYDEKDRGFFRRHRDNTGPASRHRRFSLVVALAHPTAYQGGGLFFPEYSSVRYRPEKGCAVVFASRLLHEVSPVVRGQRLVLLSRLLDQSAFADRGRERARKPQLVTAPVP